MLSISRLVVQSISRPVDQSTCDNLGCHLSNKRPLVRKTHLCRRLVVGCVVSVSVHFRRVCFGHGRGTSGSGSGLVTSGFVSRRRRRRSRSRLSVVESDLLNQVRVVFVLVGRPLLGLHLLGRGRGWNWKRMETHSGQHSAFKGLS